MLEYFIFFVIGVVVGTVFVLLYALISVSGIRRKNETHIEMMEKESGEGNSNE